MKSVEWSVARRPCPGESLCGDDFLVLETQGSILLAVTDGLGHGAEAAEASAIALATVQAHPELPLLNLLSLCDRAMTDHRGVVMTLVHLRPQNHTLCWVAVGNVSGLVIRNDSSRYGKTENILSFGGVVGQHHLPTHTPKALKLDRGDLLVITTDGISPDFAERLSLSASSEELAESVLAKYARPNDDALVLVLRYLGATS